MDDNLNLVTFLELWWKGLPFVQVKDQFPPFWSDGLKRNGSYPTKLHGKHVTSLSEGPELGMADVCPNRRKGFIPQEA